MNNIFFAVVGAFGGGVATFFTPCVLPLVPAYIIYLTGIGLVSPSGGDSAITSISSAETELSLWRKLKLAISRKAAFVHAVFFTLGFTVVFFILGLSATFFSDLIFNNKNFIRLIGGAVLIFLGLFVSGVLKIKFLFRDSRINFASAQKPAGLIGSFLVGAAFSSGWSPCVGPALVAILTLTASRESLKEGMILLGAFSAGLALPFVLAGLFTAELTVFISRIKRFFGVFEKILGFLLILAGISLVVGWL